MNYALDRDAYSRFYPDETYPKSTSAAATELRSRGLDATYTRLKSLIHAKHVRVRCDASGDYRWTAAEIDAAASILDSRGERTPAGMAAEWHGYKLADYMQAQADAVGQNPDVANPETGLAIVIIPGFIGDGVPASVSFRRVTAAEDGSRVLALVESRRKF